MGYRERTGFLAGLTVAQISEFSLIFMAMGGAIGLVTLVGLVTIAASTCMITFSHRLYAVFEPVLGIFERRGTLAEPGTGPETSPPHDVILSGLAATASASPRHSATRAGGFPAWISAPRRCVMSDARCSMPSSAMRHVVAAVKPDGFVSPLVRG